MRISLSTQHKYAFQTALFFVSFTEGSGKKGPLSCVTLESEDAPEDGVHRGETGVSERACSHALNVIIARRWDEKHEGNEPHSQDVKNERADLESKALLPGH